MDATYVNGAVRTWDGLSFKMMATREAKKLEKEGLLQITNNLSASQLKTAAQFNTVRETSMLPPGMEDAAPAAKAKRKKYNTRDMKAQS